MVPSRRETNDDGTSLIGAHPPWRRSTATQIVTVAAVYGDGVQADDLADLLGEPVGRILAGVGVLLDDGTLVVVEGNLAFQDPRACERWYRATPEPIRRCLHRRIGMLLLEAGGAPAEAADHLLAGARPASRAVLAGLDRAVHELSASSPEAAATVASRTFELTAPEDPDWPTRGVVATEALAAAGHLEQASGLARTIEASGRADHAAGAHLRLLVASIQLTIGDAADALAELEAIPTTPALPARLAARADVARLYGLTVTERAAPACELATEILAGSRASESELASRRRSPCSHGRRGSAAARTTPSRSPAPRRAAWSRSTTTTCPAPIRT